MRDRLVTLFARFIPIRPWVALAHLLIGIAITVPAFYFHDLYAAIIGAAFLGGALAVLLVPLPHLR